MVVDSGGLRKLGREHHLVVNCAGMGAGELAGRPDELEGGRGVVLVVACAREIARAAVYDEPGELTYVIPRRSDYILGGINDREESDNVARDLKVAIYERCRAMCPQLPPLADARLQLLQSVGFRPRRKDQQGVRLESEMIDEVAVVHNYGHGGAGFTVSWGCAYDVLSRVRTALAKRVPVRAF